MIISTIQTLYIYTYNQAIAEKKQSAYLIKSNSQMALYCAL